MAKKANRPQMRPADLRRRVRRITAAAVGTAALATAALTVNLAWATNDPAAASSAATSENLTPASNGTTRTPALQAPEEEGEGRVQSPQQNGITAPSAPAQAPLVAPRQAPLVGGGFSHTRSGGS